MDAWSEIREQLRGLALDSGQARKQGLVLAAALGLGGGWLWYLSHLSWAGILLGVAALIALAALARPGLLSPVLRVWMGLAFLLGQLVSRLLLVALYYGVITPLGLIIRLAGRDFLDRKLGDRDSYWHQTEAASHDPRGSDRMF